nr:efflux pump fub11 [Quercus suber]
MTSIFWDLYVALVYGILYLCFVAYPIIFTDIRGWSPGYSGLAFCGIGVGSMIVICCEPLIRKCINAHKPDPATGNPPPEAMVSVVCLAAILIPIGEVWFAWTGTPNNHWILPILAGIPFGMGNGGVFIYASNYLVHSYDIYAASALAGNAVLRSLAGATLPLAGPALYQALGPHWAGTLLALLEAACIPIPFVFYRYGWKIRAKSKLIRAMQEDRDRQDAKRAKAEQQKALRRVEAEVEMGAAMSTGAAVDETMLVVRAVEKARAGFVRVASSMERVWHLGTIQRGVHGYSAWRQVIGADYDTTANEDGVKKWNSMLDLMAADPPHRTHPNPKPLRLHSHGAHDPSSPCRCLHNDTHSCPAPSLCVRSALQCSTRTNAPSSAIPPSSSSSSSSSTTFPVAASYRTALPGRASSRSYTADSSPCGGPPARTSFRSGNSRHTSQPPRGASNSLMRAAHAGRVGGASAQRNV